MASYSLQVVAVPESNLALTNRVYVSLDEGPYLCKSKSNPLVNLVNIKDFVFSAEEHPKVPRGKIGMNIVQRRFLDISQNEMLTVSSHIVSEVNISHISLVKLEISLLRPLAQTMEIDAEKLTTKLLDSFENNIFGRRQQFVYEFQAVNLVFTVTDVESVNPKTLTPEKNKSGLFTKKSQLVFSKSQGVPLKIVGNNAGPGIVGAGPIRPDWNFDQMGIGGLNAEFSDIFRRAFASRVFPQSIITKLGINHVRGILLHGPPGTGKTLIARKIGEMLNSRPPKIVNGPEILNKYVGQSEENIRNLFVDAERDLKEKGDQSDLHIIIFDEIDAICKTRGSVSGGAGVGDSVVNQLLSKIDGVESLPNILLIGMTNRKDMIDDALLRPGRLEVHVEIGLPDAAGRLQIINIHTSKMRANNLLKGVDLEELADSTKNFTGAEIEGLVRSAASFAFNRQIDALHPTNPIDPSKLEVIQDDFRNAMKEIKPSFGADLDNLENRLTNGIIDYGAAYQKVLKLGRSFVQQVLNSERTPLVSVLFEGNKGSGKTATAISLALESQFPFTKFISAEDMMAYTESAKCQRIAKIFQDAYKSPASIIILDDIERLLEYVPIGQRFSNAILQTLHVCLKKSVKSKKMLIIGTTSKLEALRAMQLADEFSTVVRVPDIHPGEELAQVLTSLGSFTPQDVSTIARSITVPLPIKSIILFSEMAKQFISQQSLSERFIQLIHEFQDQQNSQFALY
eukprot:TRINITY_DN17610_c0_g1_i1.p1 TRINITY_DN17610_c0_g1~~TRINITY_DN17610_c0_g1_i1.p1  ORF type:complete len:739 (-),score=170.68 TRINITY_DN17610_c0_g1_i1:158-2374(-)